MFTYFRQKLDRLSQLIFYTFCWQFIANIVCFVVYLSNKIFQYGVNFNDIKEKIVVITCGDSILGQQLVKFLVDNQAKELIVGSNQTEIIEKLTKDYPKTKLTLIPLNFGSQNSVQQFAIKVNELMVNIDVLINNASVELDLDPVVGKRDNLEFHLGHAFFGQFSITYQLIDKMIANTKGGRIVTLSSPSYVNSQIFIGEFLGQKPANFLIMRELSKRLASTKVNTYSIQSGYVKTALEVCSKRLYKPNLELEIESDEVLLMPSMLFRFIFRTLVLFNPFLITKSILYCALDKRPEKETGLHYENCVSVGMGDQQVNDRVATLLFNYCCETLKLQKGTLHTL